MAMEESSIAILRVIEYVIYAHQCKAKKRDSIL